MNIPEIEEIKEWRIGHYAPPLLNLEQRQRDRQTMSFDEGIFAESGVKG